ncbi:permease prefix domain 1-containing protein [Actinophytocola sp.]|uniref:permease prefix domain 1-containing protein n=1 Tax=Actinophytocola sp. TaxID=1872138 RepID=UPI002ED4B114
MIEAYLAELDAALRGPRRAKTDLLAEARDHLVEATESYEHSGFSRQEAETAATRDFGALEDIVPGYQAELGWTQGRRTALMVLFVFAVQPFIWGIAYPRVAVTTIDSPADEVVENLGGLTILLALLMVLAYRIGMRHPAVRQRITRITGLATIVVCVLFIAFGALLTALSPDGLVLLWMITFILAPMSWTALSAWRCLATAVR